MHSRIDCPSNLILLSDLVDVQSSNSSVNGLLDAALGPAPRMGSDQSWTRGDVEKSLALRGIPPQSIHWRGANECIVRRTQGTRIDRTDSKSADVLSAKVDSAKIQGQTVQFTNQQNPVVAATPNSTPNAAPLIDKSQFTPAFTTPSHVSQAENLAALAIGDYLRAKTDSAGKWNIKVNMPTELTKLFSFRSNILGVAGGQPPWDGTQEFIFRMAGNNGEQVVPISATVRLPDMVIAAKRALSKGYVLREDDLVWIPMPRGLSYGPEDCFSQMDQLIGQQLRRSMSTQQAIRLKEVGPPTVIHVGDLVAIGIVSGAISIGTNGVAIESGALDDLIQIEVLPHKKRILGRITGDRTVEVISNGATNAGYAPRTVVSKTNLNQRR